MKNIAVKKTEKKGKGIFAGKNFKKGDRMKRKQNFKLDKAVQRSKARNKGKHFIKFCPKCRSTETDIDASMFEAWSRCTRCGFRARSFPEKERKS